MKKALIIRYAAYGDIIHMSFLPRLLKDQGFDRVDLETNFKGFQLLEGNPFINKINAINPEVAFHSAPYMIEKHWQVISEGYDKVINLYGSIENSCLAMEDDVVYYMSDNIRKKRDKNYYDQTCKWAGYPDLIGKYHGEIFYSDEEKEIVKKWMRQFKDKFTVMINLSGTGPHKRFVQVKEVIKNILDVYPKAHIITTGSKECEKWDVKDNRVTSIVGRFPFRQALLITKYVDCVIGCESGLMCGASMWHTPTIQLMTAASIDSHCKYNPNDYSLQSPAYCSPCFKGPYEYRGCPNKDGNPLCVYFDINKIIGKVDDIITTKRNRKNTSSAMPSVWEFAR